MIVSADNVKLFVRETGFYRQLVENIDFVNFPAGNKSYRWDVASQIEKRVQFYRALVLAECCLRKERQAKVDRR